MTDLRRSYRQRKLFSYDARLQQLQALHRMIKENEDQLYEAVYKDLKKVSFHRHFTLNWKISKLQNNIFE